MSKLGKFAAACAAVLCAFGACGSLFGETCTFNGSWDVTPSGEADAIVVESGSLTWGAALPAKVASWTQTGGTVTFETVYGDSGFTLFEVTGDVSLTGGKWTHKANDKKETYRLFAQVGGNMVIGADAVVDVTACGYGPGTGKGPGIGKDHTGGAYGGQGWGNDSSRLVSPCYGSVARPVNLGTGGYQSGGAGGGAVRFVVTGSLTVDGQVLSDGAQNVNHWDGSGGSVWVTAKSLSGSGRISASGGSDAGMYPSGGGRVSIVLTGENADFTDFTGKIVADPCRTTSGAVQPTAAGTVYLETAADGEGGGLLVVDRDSPTGTLVTPVTDIILDDQEPTFNPKEIILRNGATVLVTGGTRRSFKIGSRVTMEGQVAFKVSGADLDLSACDIVRTGTGSQNFSVIGTKESTIITKGPFVVEPDRALTVSAPCVLDVTSLKIAAGGVLTADKPLSVTGDMTVEAGGLVTHTANTKDSDYRLVINVAGDMTVEADGKVDAKAKGWPSRVGPGSGSTDWWAGCHGGRGYANSTDHLGVGVCYGSLTQPVELGSGSATAGSFAAAGGGAVRLSVAGKFTNDGVVNANGDGSTVYKSSPGGSVWITCGSIAGAGKIEANSFGDNGLSTSTQNSYCGGGRVAVWLTDADADFSSYSGTTVAYGARGSQYKAAGGAGTVYRKTGSQAANEGTLIIDNDVPTGYTCWPTEIGPDVTDTEVGSVIVRNGSKLRILAGSTLTVRGDWKVPAALFSTEAGGGLVFAGTRSCSVEDDLTTSAFTCREPGKEIVFAAGKTLTVSSGGSFVVEGEEGGQVSLKSSADAEVWNLNVDPTADQSVNQVAVSDCDASGGAQISAVNSTLTRTENWKNTTVVVGQTVTWTGAAGSSAWLAAGNWDAERAPLATDRLVIAPGAVQPVLSDDFTAMDLTVAAGATFDLNGKSFRTTGDLTVAGAVTTVRGGTFVANGAVDFTGATVDTLWLALELAGDGKAVQTFAADGLAFDSVMVLPNAAGVTVAGAFTTRKLTCEADAAFALSFVPGSTVSVEELLTLEGPIALASTTTGQAWNFAVTGVKDVGGGVTVSDCEADILKAPVVWTGAVSGDFSTPGNWSTGEVPGEGDDVIIGTGTVKASAAIAVGSLWLQGGADVTIDKGGTVAKTVYLSSGAALTHSANTTTEANRLILDIGGNLGVEAGAAIDVTGKGYEKGSGPGGSGRGGSHAGRGEAHDNALDNKTYGSMRWPVKLGSGGGYTSGGGAVQLLVAGVTRVDGDVAANGVKSKDFWAGAGGSVALRTASLIGNGSIAANGGDVGSDYTGGGGRIAVILTGEGETVGRFDGALEAYSGKKSSEVVPCPRGSTGTIYIEEATDGAGRGRIVIDNSPTGTARSTTDPMAGIPRTDYPVMNDASVERNEGKNATVVLRNTVGLNITANARIGNLVVEGTKPRVYLNGYTLRINTYRPADWPKDGSLPAFVIPGEDAEGNPGKIIWKQGLVIFFQ